MSYKTELTEDCMGIVHVGTGIVTGADLLDAATAARRLVQNTENFYYEFVDLTDVTEVKMTDEELNQIAVQDHFAALFRPDAVVVIVAPRDDLFAMGKKWEEKVHDLGWSTHITRERAEALRWLREHYPKAPLKSEETA